MPIIARSTADKQQDWRQILAQSLKTAHDIRRYLELPSPSDDDQRNEQIASRQFPVRVPRPFLDLAEPGNPDDPITRQVLPDAAETMAHPLFSADPLAEADANVQPGIIHKYQGRALLLPATGCAVNCRYCFRRHFDYADNRISRAQWQQSLEYVRSDNSLSEIILSGGDPLMLQDDALHQLIRDIEAIPHIRRLRIHSRLPVVIPQRLTAQLLRQLSSTRLGATLVLHINHANEMGSELQQQLSIWKQSSITLLNQSVLLKGINDNAQILQQLSESLFESGVLPYYLHVLDRVQGAAHFDRSDEEAQKIFRQLHSRLPGYLVPRLTREEAGKSGKTLLYVP